MKIIPVPVRQDNYAYLLIDSHSNKAAAIDPFDVPKVSAVAESLGLTIVAGITTHHHADHSGGNQDFAAKYPHAPIYGGSNKVLALTDLVKDKDSFMIGDNIHVKCMATPCHTQDSICYYVTDTADETYPGGVFTGDTLFIGGCGRFFEGTPEEMISSLTYLSTLPDKTVVFNGHEYTAGNLAFAKTVEPENKAMLRLGELVQKSAITTGLTTIGDEKEWNVFMRLGNDAVKKSTSKSSPANVMAALREMKNNYRG